MVIGFGFAGWVTGGSAQKMADQAALASGGGWATMPGEKEASSTVAEMCATRLAVRSS
jgi:hypothetical protein